MAGDPGSRARGRLPVILDVDTGIDDSLALLYAVASPELEVVAVTCLAGNVAGRRVAENTLAVLELAGRGDIPVALGAEAPLVKALETTEETHGPRGIGYAELPRATRALEKRHASDLIVDLARACPGEIHLVTLGPFTNLALALEREPRLPWLLGAWTFMGGVFRGSGNTTPTSEWNVHVDPDAAKACLSAWGRAIAEDPTVRLPIGMGLDVTELARILPGDVARLTRAAGAEPADADALAGGDDRAGPDSSDVLMVAAGSAAVNPMLRFIVDSLRFYFEFHARYDGFYGAFIHDPFVVAATADPSLIQTKAVFVDVETGPGLAHGMTVADWRRITGRPANAQVAVAGDAAAFVDRLVKRIGGLALSRA